MTGGKDLVVLAADKDLEHALKGLLPRAPALDIRPITFDVFVHPRHDAACARQGVAFLSNLSERYAHGLLMFDHEGSGKEQESARAVQEALNREFAGSSWGGRARAIVLSPELEAWIWSDSPHVDDVAGWKDRRPPLRRWLIDQRLLRDGETKPQRPKEAFLAALHEARVARSASLYGRMAEKVSVRRCADESFQALRRTLQNWFPRAKPA